MPKDGASDPCSTMFTRDFLIFDAPHHDDVIDLSVFMHKTAGNTPGLMESFALIKPYGSHILSADRELQLPDTVPSRIAHRRIQQ